MSNAFRPVKALYSTSHRQSVQLFTRIHLFGFQFLSSPDGHMYVICGAPHTIYILIILPYALFAFGRFYFSVSIYKCCRWCSDTSRNMRHIFNKIAIVRCRSHTHLCICAHYSGRHKAINKLSVDDNRWLMILEQMNSGRIAICGLVWRHTPRTSHPNYIGP